MAHYLYSLMIEWYRQMKPKISQNYLRSLLYYNAVTGTFTWIVDHARNKVGDIANSRSNGYIRIAINGVGYSAHRLAFIYMLDYEPYMVDHINGVRNDNSWMNLRESNASSNTFNSNYSRSSTGIRGISYNKTTDLYEVRIKPPTGRVIYRSFEHSEQAIEFNEIERRKINSVHR